MSRLSTEEAKWHPSSGHSLLGSLSIDALSGSCQWRSRHSWKIALYFSLTTQTYHYRISRELSHLKNSSFMNVSDKFFSSFRMPDAQRPNVGEHRQKSVIVTTKHTENSYGSILASRTVRHGRHTLNTSKTVEPADAPSGH